MTADIRTAAREVRLDHLLGTFKVGSREHSWTAEYDELMSEHQAEMKALITDIQTRGIQEPILLGNDGRVWDGHHRVCAAMHIGLDTIPVEFTAQERLTPTREQIAERLASTREPEYQGVEQEDLIDADAILALLHEQAGKESS